MRSAGVVNTYLNWLKSKALIESNPFDECRRIYDLPIGIIALALLHPDYIDRLKGTSGPPKFASFLGETICEFIKWKRSLGHKAEVEEKELARFDRFLQSQSTLPSRSFTDLVRLWSDSAPTARRKYDANRVCRALSKYLHRYGQIAEVIALDHELRRQVVKAERRPSPLTDEQVTQLLETAVPRGVNQNVFGKHVTYMTLVLAVCVGLRVGEISRLKLENLDFEDKTIDILGTKFFKSRRLPVDPSVVTVLRRFLRLRENWAGSQLPTSPLFWNVQTKGAYSYSWVRHSINSALIAAKLKPERGRCGPRVHDLRHTFVVRCMARWYREGINPQDRLPHLVTYLGHADLSSTLVYLTTTAEILGLASDKYRAYGADVIDSTAGAS